MHSFSLSDAMRCSELVLICRCDTMQRLGFVFKVLWMYFPMVLFVIVNYWFLQGLAWGAAQGCTLFRKAFHHEGWVLVEKPACDFALRLVILGHKANHCRECTTSQGPIDQSCDASLHRCGLNGFGSGTVHTSSFSTLLIHARWIPLCVILGRHYLQLHLLEVQFCCNPQFR